MQRTSLKKHLHLQAFNKDFVNLITARIDRVTRTGVRTVDGLEHQADAVIFATGFDLEVMINLAQTVNYSVMLIIKS